MEPKQEGNLQFVRFVEEHHDLATLLRGVAHWLEQQTDVVWCNFVVERYPAGLDGTLYFFKSEGRSGQD